MVLCFSIEAECTDHFVLIFMFQPVIVMACRRDATLTKLCMSALGMEGTALTVSTTQLAPTVRGAKMTTSEPQKQTDVRRATVILWVRVL